MPLSRIQTDALQSAITSGNILDGTIATVDVANGAITQPKLAAGALEGYMATNGTNFTFRNRIINGDMRIDQRNAGNIAASTGVSTAFGADRFPVFNQCDGGVSCQQIADAPVGFNNSLRVTITTADTNLEAIQYVEVRQTIEGFNVADLGWGTAAAQPVTLSFWVKSSLTGTFGGVFMNSAVNRSYTFSYNINSANTWEYKTISAPGDTLGTWEKTNGNGMFVILNLGAGTSFQGTANTWSGNRRHTVPNAVNLAATSGATWQVTGLQLEKGSTASAFEYRPIGTELALCQRYCTVYGNPSSSYERFGVGNATSTTVADINVFLPVQMRTTPTAVTSTVGNFAVYNNSALRTVSAISVDFSSSKIVTLTVTTSSLTAASALSLVANQNTTSFIQFLAEI